MTARRGEGIAVAVADRRANRDVTDRQRTRLTGLRGDAAEGDRRSKSPTAIPP